MKVRILSGAQKGAVVEVSQGEMEASVATGFAELVPEVPVTAFARPAPVLPVPVVIVEDDVGSEVEDAPRRRSRRT